MMIQKMMLLKGIRLTMVMAAQRRRNGEKKCGSCGASVLAYSLLCPYHLQYIAIPPSFIHMLFFHSMLIIVIR